MGKEIDNKEKNYDDQEDHEIKDQDLKDEAKRNELKLEDKHKKKRNKRRRNKYSKFLDDLDISEDVIDELYNLWDATKEYLSSKHKPLKEVSIERNISSNKIRLFSKYFVKIRKLVPSYFAYNGYSAKMGLEYALAQARIYYEINNKIPTAREFRKYRSGILHAINSGYWKKLGVKNVVTMTF